jgi:hypothetical protein
MAGLFSNRNDHSYGGIGLIYFMANNFRPMGFSILDFRHRPFALQPISSENDLDLLSAERQKRWDLKFRSVC